MTALFKEHPIFKKQIKTWVCFFFYTATYLVISLCFLSPQVLIVDLCADKFLQEVSEVTVAVTHGFMPGKGIDERK